MSQTQFKTSIFHSKYINRALQADSLVPFWFANLILNHSEHFDQKWIYSEKLVSGDNRKIVGTEMGTWLVCSMAPWFNGFWTEPGLFESKGKTALVQNIQMADGIQERSLHSYTRKLQQKPQMVEPNYEYAQKKCISLALRVGNTSVVCKFDDGAVITAEDDVLSAPQPLT